jgi:MSHA biogenesis protein MshQ
VSDVNDLRFAAANARGGMQVTISSLVGSPAWAQHLNFDWNGDGVINGLDTPTATINFGVFRGNDRKINFREVLE